MFADHCCACSVLRGVHCDPGHGIHYCERHGAEARIVPATLFRELARARADGAFTERLRIRVRDDRELLRRLSHSSG